MQHVGIEVTILGSGTSVPNPKRSSPGLVISYGNEPPLLFDTGSGTLWRLSKLGISIQDVQYIFYSHLHPDHTVDLVSILFALRNPDYIRKKELCIIAYFGFQDFYTRLVDTYSEWVKPRGYNLIIREISEETFPIQNWKVTSKRLLHHEYSIGFRLESDHGRVVVYSGDTDYCENIIELARDSDILILECSFPDELRVEGHLTPSLAGKIASLAHAKKLILTHLYPQCDDFDILSACKHCFDGEVIVASDFMKLTL
ncbi:MAG: ribonuclease Z [Thermodesulfobacteriota bacterium]|nr:ribonuclease Z [Thermodesulfobacteriota bacterium]